MTIGNLSKYILLFVFIILGVIPRFFIDSVTGDQYIFITTAGYILLIALSSAIYFHQVFSKEKDPDLDFTFDFVWVFGFFMYTNIIFFPLAFRAMLPFLGGLVLLWMLYLTFKIIWKKNYIKYFRIAMKILFLLVNTYFVIIGTTLSNSL